MTRENRDAVMETANVAINGSRNEEYGEPFNDFARVAALWSVLFDREFMPEDVAKALICLKLGRLSHTPAHFDSWVDIAGYSACGWDAYQDSMDIR